MVLREKHNLQQPPDLPVDMGHDFECERIWQDPKGGELYLTTVKPWETVVKAGISTDVQIVCQSWA